MIKRIDLFMPNVSQYGVLHHFTQKLYEALTRRGVRCRLLTGTRNNLAHLVSQILEDRPDFTLTFNGMPPDPLGKFLCDAINIPHINYLVDSAARYTFLVNSPNNIITCVDRASCDFYKELGFNNAHFLPHGAEANLNANPDNPKHYDVVLLGSYIDYQSIEEQWKNTFSQNTVKALKAAADSALYGDAPYFEAFRKNMDLYSPKEASSIPLLNEFELYIRGLERTALIGSITDAPVHIFSTGTKDQWHKLLGKKQKNINFHDQVPFETALEIMSNAKITLNSCAWIKDGGHERIFYGMSCGSVILTAENPYLKESFNHKKNILFYPREEMKKVNDIINETLTQESARKKVAQLGQKVAAKNHSWDQRAAALLKIIKQK